MTCLRRWLVVTTFVGIAACVWSCSKDKAPAPGAAAPAPEAQAQGAAPPSPQQPQPASPGSPAPATGQPSGALPPLASKYRPNLILITMEATRPDHLGTYDDALTPTPGLDVLAHEGAIFEQAIAASPLTLPSHASIFTGLYPPRHGVRDNSGFTLDDAQTTLAEHLKANGYRTSAAVGNSIFAGPAGLMQGFDHHAEPKKGSRSATFVVDDAIAAIERMNGAPFFLWVQFDDPHAPYAPPPPFGTQYAARPYDGELAWMDAQIKRLLDYLRTQGLLDASVVVAVGSSGEGLGEHGEDTHGLLLYDTTLRVPLLVRFPRAVKAGTRSKALVSLVDLAPTLVDLLGVPSIATTQGTNFLPILLGADMGEREPAYAESLFGERTFGWVPLHMMRTAKRKFIDGPTAEIYDILRDPSETINAASKNASEVAIARNLMVTLMQSIGGVTELAAGKGAASRREPRTMVAAANLFMKAQAEIELGHAGEAAGLLQQALVKDPGNQAAKSLLAALRGQPVAPTGAAANTFAGQWNLGNSLYVQGKFDEAAKAFRAALAINPSSAETHYVLGNVLAAKGDAAGAEEELRAALTADPKMADAWNKLGIVFDKSKRRPQAIDAFTKAITINPNHADALFNRAKLELLETYLPDARRDVDHLMKTHPEYAPGLFLDAHLCVAEKNSTGAKAALTKLIAVPNLEPGLKAAAEDMLKKIGA
jgi:arylsulfatase A-like enzyme/Tfp pilus assembly protein PilF